MIIHGHEIHGAVIDEETRCLHYHGETDRIAIKFFCCEKWFPCHACHSESGCGGHAVWPEDRFSEKAVLCGACGHELTVAEYLDGDSACPSCVVAFNPGCRLHRHLYFGG
nr:CHY zinc finger protein [Bhargavaea cecembensis]